MVMFYHAEACRCGNGWPPDAPCDCAGRTCGCYGEGYADGKDKAHFEVRALAEGREHGPGCECRTLSDQQGPNRRPGAGSGPLRV